MVSIQADDPVELKDFLFEIAAELTFPLVSRVAAGPDVPGVSEDDEDRLTLAPDCGDGSGVYEQIRALVDGARADVSVGVD